MVSAPPMWDATSDFSIIVAVVLPLESVLPLVKVTSPLNPIPCCES